jgi:malate synthase
VNIAGLSVDKGLYDLVADEIAPGTGIAPYDFWSALSNIVQALGPGNRSLLLQRDRIQSRINGWHRQHRGRPVDPSEYKSFLTAIGYLVPEGPDFKVTVDNVDPEVAEIAGPQLVVPVDNARYALNAANARWGSLYDALYGTNVIPEEPGLEKGRDYNPRRGARVFQRVWAFLDDAFPLAQGSHTEIRQYTLANDGKVSELAAVLESGQQTGLADTGKFAGYQEENGELSAILLRNNDLHAVLRIDRMNTIGRTHPAGVKDVILEATPTTIQDCEDSRMAVDAEDKCRVYRNWLGLMKGTLEAAFTKNGTPMSRRLQPDVAYTAPDGGEIRLPGRSLMLVRNVGLHMYTDAVQTSGGEEIPETFLDAMVTVLAAMHDLRGKAAHANSRTGSIYIVKPKLHGPKEVAASVALFERIEKAFGLAPNTIKVGIMDEERRTTVNLKECIRRAKERAIFINTGFLDRTGDEIHTDMEAGPLIPKTEMKASTWMLAYEDWNVDTGLAVGLTGRAQIGKGMWAMPDDMRSMLATKAAHPQSGASAAWVPSPTAATLHVLHYHQVNVAQRQKALAKQRRARLDDLLTIPLLDRQRLQPEEIRKELENNAQSILGYVVRWIDQGIGCSKVPDINNVALMEDRATLRISSQHIANWLHHGLTTRDEVVSVFQKMAGVVDRQNAAASNYCNMAPDLAASAAFQAALELIFRGCERPNGYTEWTLHAYRRRVKNVNKKQGDYDARKNH